MPGGLRAENTQCASGNEMALQVEGVVDGGMNGQESLGGARRLEPLLLPFALSDRLMPRAQADVSESRRIGSKLVRYNDGRCEPLLLEERAHEFPRRRCVSPSLHQNIENLAFVIDGTPEVHALAADEDDHFVQVPP